MATSVEHFHSRELIVIYRAKLGVQKQRGTRNLGILVQLVDRNEGADCDHPVYRQRPTDVKPTIAGELYFNSLLIYIFLLDAKS